MKNRILIGLLCTITLFFGCGNQDSSESEKAALSALKTIEKPEFRIQLPTSWEEIHPSRVGEGISDSENIYSYFQSRRDDFTSEGIFFTVVTEKIPKDISTLEFFYKTRENEKDTFFEYTFESTTDVIISGQNTKFIVFKARMNPDAQQFHYSQTFLFNNGVALVFTIGIPTDSEEITENMILNIFKSIQLLPGDVAKW